MYCVKCRTKKQGKDVKVVEVASIKRKIQVGVCETCGTKMVRMGVPQ